ncbi:hypothetical protein D3C78_948730 [compost metagenome]
MLLWCGFTLGRLEVGEEFLPVQLAILLSSGPGFETLAVHFADHYLLLDQVQAGFAHIQAGQLYQWPFVGGLEVDALEAQGGLVEQKLSIPGKVQFVAGSNLQHALFELQRHVVAYVRPPGLERNTLDRQAAVGGDRHQAQLTLPIQTPAIRAGGHQRHLRPLIRQGAEIVQFEAHRIEGELHGFAGAAVLEMHAAFGQLDTIDA